MPQRPTVVLVPLCSRSQLLSVLRRGILRYGVGLTGLTLPSVAYDSIVEEGAALPLPLAVPRRLYTHT